MSTISLNFLNSSNSHILVPSCWTKIRKLLHYNFFAAAAKQAASCILTIFGETFFSVVYFNFHKFISSWYFWSKAFLQFEMCDHRHRCRKFWEKSHKGKKGKRWERRKPCSFDSFIRTRGTGRKIAYGNSFPIFQLDEFNKKPEMWERLTRKNVKRRKQTERPHGQKCITCMLQILLHREKLMVSFFHPPFFHGLGFIKKYSAISVNHFLWECLCLEASSRCRMTSKEDGATYERVIPTKNTRPVLSIVSLPKNISPCPLDAHEETTETSRIGHEA